MMHPFCSVNVNARLMNSLLSLPPQSKQELLKHFYQDKKTTMSSHYNKCYVISAVINTSSMSKQYVFPHDLQSNI